MNDALDPKAVDLCVELIQSGEQITVAHMSSKYFETLIYRGGQYYLDISDEGSRDDWAISETEARAKLAAVPDACRELMARAVWRAFFSAFVDGSREEARAAFEATRGLPGQAEHYSYLYEALLDWPETSPSAEVSARLRELARGEKFFDPFRVAASGRDDPNTTKKSFEYLTALGEVTDWPTNLIEQRAEVHERQGNLQAALDDLLKVQKLEPPRRLAARIRKLRKAILSR